MFISSIPQGHCRVIERFGKPVCVQGSGLRFKIPILDKIKDVSPLWGDETNKNGIFIELTEQITDTPPREYFTKDIRDCSQDTASREINDLIAKGVLLKEGVGRSTYYVINRDKIHPKE